MTVTPLRVLALGAGVQSTTLLLMALHGEVDGKLDAAVFADTGWESKATYAHLDWLEKEMAYGGVPVHRVSAGNIRDEHMESTVPGYSGHYARMPLFVNTGGEREGKIRRQCTSKYKIKPIRAKIRELLGINPRSPGPREVVCEQWFGISVDEYQRMRTTDVRWLTHRYPLVDARMTRQDCVLWLERHGYPVPPKSACIGCPYHNAAYWREMKLSRPDEWADAVDFDRRIRHLPRIEGEVFLYHSLRPLDEVDLRNAQDNGQLDLFANECEGMCGV